MTVTTTDNTVTLTGNDATINWPSGFPVLAAAHLTVQVLDTLTSALVTISAVNYAVSGIGDVSGVTVTYPTSGTPLTTTEKIILTRIVPYTQTLDIENQGGFFPEVVEAEMDLQVMMIQQLVSQVGKVIAAPIFDSDLLDFELPPAADRAEKYMYFASDGSVSVTGTAPAVQYQGAFTTAGEPTLRLAGGALQDGDLYFNTDDTRLKVYDTGGGTWSNGVDSATTIDIVGMTALGDPLATGDFLPIYDLSNTANRKMTPQQLFNHLDLLSALGGTPAITDKLAMYDSTAKTVSVTNLFQAIGGFTADATPDTAADYVMTLDATDGLPKKVLIDNLVTSGGLIRGTPIATTSGTAHGFTGIPAGVNQIIFMLSGVSLSGTDEYVIQIGDSGGYEATGYVSAAAFGAGFTTSTTGFNLTFSTAAATVNSGMIVLNREDGNTWTSTGRLNPGATAFNDSSGVKTLSAELDRIQITTNGTNTFDAGSVNIMYQ